MALIDAIIHRVEFGVIAGERDLMVGPGRTRLDGMADHTEFPCMHTSLIFRRDVADAISRVLEDGKFNGKPSA